MIQASILQLIAFQTQCEYTSHVSLLHLHTHSAPTASHPSIRTAVWWMMGYWIQGVMQGAPISSMLFFLHFMSNIFSWFTEPFSAAGMARTTYLYNIKELLILLTFFIILVDWSVFCLIFIEGKCTIEDGRWRKWTYCLRTYCLRTYCLDYLMSFGHKKRLLHTDENSA